MGQTQRGQAIAERQPTLHEFVHLCTETDISQHSQAQDWALQLLSEGDFQARWRLTKVFSRLGKQAIAPLLAIAEDETAETELRWFAIRIVGQYRDAEAIARLIVLLDHCREDFLTAEIMAALVQLEETATEYVIPLLAKPETRLLAVQALCKLRYPNVVSPLLTVVHDTNAQIRALAIEALSSFRHPQILAVMLDSLADPASQVRLEALIGLGFWANTADPQMLLDHVQPLLHDVHLAVCRQAAFTLSRLQTPAAATAIATVLQAETTPISLQLDLVQALGWLDVPQSLEWLAKTLPTGSEPLILGILKVLGRISEPPRQIQATTILLNFWAQSESPKTAPIRQALGYTLGQLQDQRADVVLRELAADSDERVKLHAIAALRKIQSATTSTP